MLIDLPTVYESHNLTTTEDGVMLFVITEYRWRSLPSGGHIVSCKGYELQFSDDHNCTHNMAVIEQLCLTKGEFPLAILSQGQETIRGSDNRRIVTHMYFSTCPFTAAGAPPQGTPYSWECVGDVDCPISYDADDFDV